MLQIVMNSGKDNEEVMELVDTHEYVLMQFLEMTLKYRDMRDPQHRRIAQEFLDALKVKAGKEPDSPHAYNREALKKYIADIEDALSQIQIE